MRADLAAMLAVGLLVFGAGFVFGIAYGVRRMKLEIEEREWRVRRYNAVRGGGR